jgi:hypothetical protein
LFTWNKRARIGHIDDVEHVERQKVLRQDEARYFVGVLKIADQPQNCPNFWQPMEHHHVSGTDDPAFVAGSPAFGAFYILKHSQNFSHFISSSITDGLKLTTTGKSQTFASGIAPPSGPCLGHLEHLVLPCDAVESPQGSTGCSRWPRQGQHFLVQGLSSSSTDECTSF